MRVVVDQQECSGQAQTVEQAIEMAAALAQQRGRLIVEVLVDGEQFDPDGGRDQGSGIRDQGVSISGGASGASSGVSSGASSGGVKEVRMVTADAGELVRETFAQAGDSLREADSLQQAAAELIQAGQTRQAMEQLGEALAIWSAVQQALTMGATVAGLEIEDEIEAAGLHGLVERLNEKLKAIGEALESGDPVGLADTLLYEMPEINLQWRSLLEAMITRAGSGG